MPLPLCVQVILQIQNVSDWAACLKIKLMLKDLYIFMCVNMFLLESCVIVWLSVTIISLKN